MIGMGMTERECERCAGKGTVSVKPETIREAKKEEETKIVEPLKEEAVKDDRETEVKTVAQTKRKYVRKAKEEEAPDGVCNVA
jgi:hypothetical protein